MKTYLIAHTNVRGTNIACAQVNAKTQQGAKNRFRKRHRDRVITVVGVKGGDGG